MGERASSRPAGFTLVELVVVTIILAVAAAIVVPQLTGTASLQCQSASRLVMADLEYAQSQAIVSQAPVTVTFNPGAGTYTLSNESDTLPHPITKKPYVVALAGRDGFERVTIDGPPSVVRFTALGAPDQAGSVTLVAGASEYRVNVAAVTGRVTVVKVR